MLLLKRTLIWFVCLSFFSGISYLYLYNDKKEKSVEEKQESVPYYSNQEDIKLLLSLPDGELLLDISFEEKQLNIYKNNFDSYDYSIKTDETFIAGIIDRIGGLELTLENETLRYTGIQIIQLIYGHNNTDESLKLSVLKTFFEKVAAVGLNRNDFIYIIENTKTDLNIPTCFNWHEYSKSVCSNTRIIED